MAGWQNKLWHGRNHSAAALALCCVTLCVSAVRAEDARTTAVRAVLQKRYKQWAAAYLKNDGATLARMLAPRFTLRTESGRVMTRPQYEAILRKRNTDSGPQVKTYATRINRLAVSSDGSVATAYTVETVTEAPAKGVQAEGVTHMHQYRDQWSKRGGAWYLLSSQTLSEQSKPAPHSPSVRRQ